MIPCIETEGKNLTFHIAKGFQWTLTLRFIFLDGGFKRNNAPCWGGGGSGEISHSTGLGEGGGVVKCDLVSQ